MQCIEQPGDTPAQLVFNAMCQQAQFERRWRAQLYVFAPQFGIRLQQFGAQGCAKRGVVNLEQPEKLFRFSRGNFTQ